MLGRIFTRFKKPLNADQLSKTPTAPVQSVNDAPTHIPPVSDSDHNRDQVSEGVRKTVAPERIALLQKIGENLHLVMRMAAMNMLREEEGGYVMDVPGHSLRMPDAHTLFDAYLAIEAAYGLDWKDLDDALKEPWVSEVIKMVTDKESYLSVWHGLRRQIASEALAIGTQIAAGTPDQRNVKVFTLLAIHVCDKVISTLSDSEDADDE